MHTGKYREYEALRNSQLRPHSANKAAKLPTKLEICFTGPAENNSLCVARSGVISHGKHVPIVTFLVGLQKNCLHFVFHSVPRR